MFKFFGRRSDKPPTANIATLMSQTAIDESFDLLNQYAEPDRILASLGKTRTELRKLLADDEISGALETRLAAVQGTDWHLEAEEGEVTEFVNHQLDEHLSEIIRAAWGATPFGYSVIETVWAKVNGRLVWQAIEQPPFEWFRPQPGGALRYFPQFGGGSGYGDLVDTDSKFFLTRRNPTVTNQNGDALLSILYWPWFFRTKGWDFWARFLERHGAPLLVGKTVGDKSKMANALAAAVQSAVIAVDKDSDINAITTNNRGESFRDFSEVVDKRIQKVILGQTLTTDVGDSGSYAAAKVHNDVRMDRKQADCMLVSRTVNRMIHALVRWNFPGADAPLFVMEDSRGLETGRAERDKVLTEAGIVRLTKEYILKNYDLDEGDFEIPEPAQNQPPPAFAMRPGASAFAAQRDDEFTPGQQAVEDLAVHALDRTVQPIPVSAIQAAISAATGPDDLAERLSALYGDQDAAGFRRVLERALFAADVLGYVNQEEGVA